MYPEGSQKLWTDGVAENMAHTVRSEHRGTFNAIRGFIELEAQGVILDGLDTLPVPMFKGGKINLFLSDDSNQMIGNFSAFKNTANLDIGSVKINKFPGIFFNMYHKAPDSIKLDKNSIR
jgi:hypothetical protein